MEAEFKVRYPINGIQDKGCGLNKDVTLVFYNAFVLSPQSHQHLVNWVEKFVLPIVTEMGMLFQTHYTVSDKVTMAYTPVEGTGALTYMEAAVGYSKYQGLEASYTHVLNQAIYPEIPPTFGFLHDAAGVVSLTLDWPYQSVFLSHFKMLHERAGVKWLLPDPWVPRLRILTLPYMDNELLKRLTERLGDSLKSLNFSFTHEQCSLFGDTVTFSHKS